MRIHCYKPREMLSSSSAVQVAALPPFEADSELVLGGADERGEAKAVGCWLRAEPRVLQASVDNDVFSCGQVSRPGAEMNAETQDPLVDLRSGGIAALSQCIFLGSSARFEPWQQRFVVSGRARTRALQPVELPPWFRRTGGGEHPADATALKWCRPFPPYPPPPSPSLRHRLARWPTPPPPCVFYQRTGAQHRTSARAGT